MTTLNFGLTRALARDRLRAGDEILVTRLDHDANVSPWLAIAEDRDLTVRFVDIREDCTLDLDDLERQLSDKTRVVAFPWAANAVGTVSDVARISALAHDAGALAWIDAVHYAPHGPIDVAAAGADVLLCSPYKFFGPHMGLFFARAELLAELRPYKVRPAPDDPLSARFEPGTQQHELLAGLVAAVEYIEETGWDAIHRARARALGALPRRAPGRGHALRCPDRRRPHADLRREHRRAARPSRSPTSWPPKTSRSGRATTTRSRSCSAWDYPTARCASASSTTTRSTRSTASSRSWRRSPSPCGRPRRSSSARRRGGSSPDRFRARRPGRA